MSVYTTSLFFGIPRTESLDQALRCADPQLLQSFLSSDGQYLHEIKHHDVVYLGKPLGEICDLKALTLLESNIYSLLKKIVPEYPVTKTPLKLIAIHK